MKYYIGIDGGGTKTDCILVDESNNLLSFVKGRSLNILTSGTIESAKTILGLINTSISNQGANLNELVCIGISAAGAGRQEDSSKLENRLQTLLPRSIFVKVITDAEAALEGAFDGNPGCILISGTGSIIFGKDDQGLIHRCGGFGKTLGDEGSGYMLGKKGLRAALEEFDSRGDKTLITFLLKDKYQVESAEDIINSVYNKDLDIAGIAPLVLASAGNNDVIALKIIDEETEELMNLIYCMINKLKKDNIEICFSGKLISTVNVFSTILRKKISESGKSIKIIEPVFPPALGAVFIAKKNMAGISR
jgi:N-acetylglucosamine kinase-like BadF-type ATPase